MATPPVFTSGSVLTAAQMNAVGLWEIGSTTFSASSTPFINLCFSSDYQNYRVVIDANASGSVNMFARMRSGTNTPESGSVYDRFGFRVLSGSFSSLVAANQVDMFINAINTGNDKTSAVMDIFAPNETTHSRVIVQSIAADGTLSCPAYRIETTTAYTGIELGASSGATLTGTMRVYGYRN